jgi:hypothetical protein
MNHIPIIYYHSVAPKKKSQWYKSYLTLEQIYFEDLMLFLKRENYQFVFLDEYFSLWQSKSLNKHKYVCIHFDDGCLDNYVHVFPFIKKYGIKITIFINPEFVPDIIEPRKTMVDVWGGNIKEAELEDLGFCSWSEMKIMEDSGLVDIQSHTHTHTKYYTSDKIRDFHHPKSNYLYPIANKFPSHKPTYITDPNFVHLIPFGTPFFEEKSSVITKRHFVSVEFEKACIEKLSSYNWEIYDREACLKSIKEIYDQYKVQNKLLERIESDVEYENRVMHELRESKRLIELNLKKAVKYCCWPHGDYNQFAHNAAMELGYHATSIVLGHSEVNDSNNRFDRIGHGNVKNNRFLTLLKMKYKLNLLARKFPYYLLQKAFVKLKYG